jgi:hypothetical protein
MWDSLEQVLKVVTQHNWLPAFTWRCLHPQVGVERPQADIQMEIPVMLATVLGLELLLQEPSIDLDRVSELILSDGW